MPIVPALVSDRPAPDRSSRWLVLKFGGTSVSKRTRWDTIGRLASERAQQEAARVLVVVSALSGVTNELTAICDGDDIDTRVAALVDRHRAFCGELDLDTDEVLGKRIAALRGLAVDSRMASLALDWQAEVLAQGELLSSTIGVAYLRASGHDIGWCDARHWLDAVSLPNASAWAQRLSVNCNREAD
ncbi:MAG: bifunctional aspartate kinase/diaminopimelate decarboxylase, partial [Thermomonas sp.]